MVIKSYDSDLKVFIPFPELPTLKQELITSLMKNEIELLLRNLKNVKQRKGTGKFLKTMTIDWNDSENIMGELNVCLKSGMFKFLNNFVQKDNA